MPSYKAPVEDVLFLLNDVFRIERLDNLPGFAEASPDVVEAVLFALASPRHVTMASIVIDPDKGGLF